VVPAIDRTTAENQTNDYEKSEPEKLFFEHVQY
jgi:hypothetical protein